MKRWLRHPIYTAVLAVIWMILQERMSLGEFLIGYVIGAVIVHLFRNFWAERVRILDPVATLRLAFRFAVEVVQANLQVAWIVIRPSPAVRPAFLVLPLELKDDLAITGLANMITLTPGTVTVDIAPDRSALYVHCLSTEDVEEVRRHIKRVFETPLKRSVTCSPL